jgi:2-polyprenyl-3-methyl-5-hydroxy-6-metoxy-1,4-benzoquinol methylase
MECLSNCLVCGSKKIIKKKSLIDYSLTKETFTLYQCLSCAVVFTNPRPKKDKIKKYYDLKKYDSYSKKNDFFGFVYGFIQKLNNSYKTNLLKKYKTGSLLDYGSGSGSFVNYTQKKGYTSFGYEPINKLKHNFIYKNKIIIKKQKYDWVTLWHVLEHTHNPKSTLKGIGGLLNKDGLIAVAIPNIASYDNIYYKKYWAGYDVPRHLFHFNTTSFKKLATFANLKIINKKPLWFDPIYVSMLSEKYKKNKFSFLSGFFRGFISNLYAIKTGQHSSIIYILRKC